MAVKSSFKNMTICLLAICLVCSGLLAGVYALTKNPIDNAAKAKNEAAIKEVLPETAVAIEEERTVEMSGETYTYNLAYDQLGNTVGCAVNISTLGFGGPIVIKVGFDVNGIIWNTKVLSQSETPGLGAKIADEPSFAEAFVGKTVGEGEILFEVAKPANRATVNNGVDAISGATITSQALGKTLNQWFGFYQNYFAENGAACQQNCENCTECTEVEPANTVEE